MDLTFAPCTSHLNIYTSPICRIELFLCFWFSFADYTPFFFCIFLPFSVFPHHTPTVYVYTLHVFADCTCFSQFTHLFSYLYLLHPTMFCAYTLHAFLLLFIFQFLFLSPLSYTCYFYFYFLFLFLFLFFYLF